MEGNHRCKSCEILRKSHLGKSCKFLQDHLSRSWEKDSLASTCKSLQDRSIFKILLIILQELVFEIMLIFIQINQGIF